MGNKSPALCQLEPASINLRGLRKVEGFFEIFIGNIVSEKATSDKAKESSKGVVNGNVAQHMLTIPINKTWPWKRSSNMSDRYALFLRDLIHKLEMKMLNREIVVYQSTCEWWALSQSSEPAMRAMELSALQTILHGRCSFPAVVSMGWTLTETAFTLLLHC